MIVTKGAVPLESPQREKETRMNAAAELLAMDQCLKTVTFQRGDRVHDGQGQTGTVLSGRLGIDGPAIENEFQIGWDDGDISWVAERRLSCRIEVPENERCASAMSSSIG
jgi:hypothetical protein